MIHEFLSQMNDDYQENVEYLEGHEIIDHILALLDYYVEDYCRSKGLQIFSFMKIKACYIF